MGQNNVQKKRNAQAKKGQQNLMGWTLGIIVIACVALFVFRLASGGSDEAATAVVEPQTFNYEQQPALGSKDAPVQIVEFADFKCPACKAFDESFLPQLKKEFIDTGIAQLHFINYPIISPSADSRTAAMAGEAVFNQNPEAFWSFYEAVFQKQEDERTKWATSDKLTQIAKDAGLKLDFDKMKQDIDNDTYAQAVKDDESIVRKLGVNSTPTLFINGKRVANDDTFNYPALQQAIRDAQGTSGK